MPRRPTVMSTPSHSGAHADHPLPKTHQGEPLRSQPDPSAQARYAALFCDDIGRWPALLENIHVDGQRCLDLDVRAGHGAQALRHRGAKLVWGLAGGGERLYGGEAHHLMRGQVGWVADHPDILSLQHRFDLLVCSGLQWVLPQETQAQTAAWISIKRLLNPRGRLVFVWPAKRPGLRPAHRTLAPGVHLIEHRVDRTHWQCRVGAAYPPWIQQGACLSLRQCVQALTRAGFSAIAYRPLDSRYVCFEVSL